MDTRDQTTSVACSQELRGTGKAKGIAPPTRDRDKGYVAAESKKDLYCHLAQYLQYASADVTGRGRGYRAGSVTVYV